MCSQPTGGPKRNRLFMAARLHPWNVKFAALNSTNQFAGKDRRVVERGDFVIRAGSNNETCYRGSYMMTWLPQADQSWKLQIWLWQDVETEIVNCKT